MSSKKRTDKDREFGKGGPEDRRRPVRKKVCKFCLDRATQIDFRDSARLLKFTSERGKILPRRVSGNCSRHQRQLAQAIKRARSLAIMPYLAA